MSSLQHENFFPIEKHQCHPLLSPFVLFPPLSHAEAMSEETRLKTTTSSLLLSSSCLSLHRITLDTSGLLSHLVIRGLSRVRTFSDQLRSASDKLPLPLCHSRPDLVSSLERESRDVRSPSPHFLFVLSAD